MSFLGRMMMSTALVWGAGAGGVYASEGLPQDTERLVVTGSPLAQSLAESMSSLAILDREAVLSNAGATLGDLLSTVPGITSTSFAPGASRPIIRGQDNARVRMQENGIGTGDVADLSEDHAVPVDPFAVQRIEVIRGPAVLRYGSEALGGVVNVINNRVPVQKPDAAVQGEAFAAVTTGNDGLDGGVLLEGAQDAVAWHLDAAARTADDYDIPRSPNEQANTGLDAHSVAGGVAFHGDAGVFGLAVNHYASEYDIPAAEHPIYLDLARTQVTLVGDWDVDAGPFNKITVDGGLGYYTHDEIDREDGTIGSTFDHDTLELRTEALHGGLFGGEGAVGVQLRGADLEATGEGGELIAPAETQAYGLFVLEEAPLNAVLTLEAGARVEHVSVDGTAFSTVGGGTETPADLDFTPVSGSLGLRWDVAETTALSLTGHVTQRAPSALELFAKGPHEATETFELGNSALDEETAAGFELVLRHRGEAFRADVSGFYTQVSDYIFKQFTGISCGEDFASCGVEDELTQLTYTATDADLMGFEISASADVAQWGSAVISLDGRADYVRARLDEGGDVPRTPPFRVGGGLSMTDGPMSARLGVLRVFEQNDVAVNETSTKGHTLVDLGVALTVPEAWVGFQGLSVGMRSTNLLNEDVRNHSSFKKADVLLPGATTRVTARLVF